MLGVTEQVFYDAYMSGVPVSADYRPDGCEEGWRKFFGEELPTISQLYHDARATFTSVAGSNDSLIAQVLQLSLDESWFG